MQDARRTIQKAIDDIEAPLHIAQECLYHREKRNGSQYSYSGFSKFNFFLVGLELVHDTSEQALLKEIETYRNCQEKLKCLFNKTQDQLRNNRAAQHELETDVKSKDSALGIDNMCHQLNNFSKGINYYGGVEKFDPT